MADGHPMSFWDFLDGLTRDGNWRTIGKLAGITAMTILVVVAGGAMIASYFWAGGIEIVPSAGSIKLLQENRQYKMQLVHPFGWQTTDVYLDAGQRADISAGGMVTVGYLQQFWDHFSYRAGEKCISVSGRFARPLPDCINIGAGRTPLPNVRWPWVGPAGYDPKIYKEAEYELTPFGGENATVMMVAGVPHGSLVGYIRPEGQTMSPDERVPKGEVYELGKSKTITARQAGVLWVGVNDSGPYFHDNLGYFSLTISTGASDR